MVIGAESDVRKMPRILKSIRPSNAEQRQLTEEIVKLWIHRLNDVSFEFEIDDVMDDWSTVILQRRVEANQPDLN
ncbi:unnamed protein product [Linum tenue]|uniref:Disease resistance N-terminal domain-containing protein n=1 Tax=Linum tenue TaxID=586396 RepID=A0AAV0RMB2_9ROSI|nr:unnamed protein product [Linum tenue]